MAFQGKGMVTGQLPTFQTDHAKVAKVRWQHGLWCSGLGGRRGWERRVERKVMVVCHLDTGGCVEVTRMELELLD